MPQPDASPDAADPGTPPAPPANVWLVGQAGHEAQRAGRYSRASVRSHPGKMLPELARRLLELYTAPGDRVLDPMSGIGTTGVEAVSLGRDYVGVELEPRFAAWQRENLGRTAAAGAPGRIAVRIGDARRIAPAGEAGPDAVSVARVDAILTSPPYGDRLREQRNPSRRLRELIGAGAFGRNVLPGTYGRDPTNLGNLPNAAYLRAMAGVYAACFAVLRPGGTMAVVVQPERCRGALLPLHHETARLCAGAGFLLVDEVLAVVGRVAASAEGASVLVPHASYWRRLTCARLREAGLPVTLGQVEHVLVFRKPENAPATVTSRTRPAGSTKAAARPPLPHRRRRLGSQESG